ncbi:MAG: acyltransferase [Actinoplanes sp.]
MTETVRPRAAPRSARRSRLFRPDIEGLRAVAVVAVVLCHAGVPGLAGGYIGVDVFFVISGFLITARMLREITATGRLSLLGFYGRRARRILPAAGVVLVATTLAGYHWLGFLAGERIGADAVWATLFASNIRSAAAGADYLAAQDAPSALLHFWSLAVEEQFYLFWPAVVLLLVGLGGRRILAVGLALAVLASFALSAVQAGDTWSYFSPAARGWELGAGCLLALVADRLDRIPPRPATYLAGIGLALIVVAALSFDETTRFPGYAAVLPVLGALLVLAGRGDALLARPPVRWLGRISYSLYLWHWPVLVIGAQAYGGPKVLLVLLAVALAAVTYALVEAPIMHSAGLRRSAVATLAVALMLIVTPIAVVWWKSTGPSFQPRWGAHVSN